MCHHKFQKLCPQTVSFVADLQLQNGVVPPVSWLIWTESFVASGSFDMS